MMSCGFRAFERDYCADYYAVYKKCLKEYMFLNQRFCHDEKHVYTLCRLHEVNNRIKNFERERRLMEREAKKNKE